MPAIVGPDGKWDPAHVERFLARGGWQDVQGMQAPSAQAVTAERVARIFHEAYERLAPTFGYETREASAVPWEEVPEPNRSLMIAVAGEVVEAIKPDTVTSGHGECCCSECETGWAAAWAAWVGR